MFTLKSHYTGLHSKLLTDCNGCNYSSSIRSDDGAWPMLGNQCRRPLHHNSRAKEGEEEEEEEEENIYNKINGGTRNCSADQETSVETCIKGITAKYMILFDKNKRRCKQCLSEKINCKTCPSFISRGNITTPVKKMNGASYNGEQCNRVFFLKLMENNISFN